MIRLLAVLLALSALSGCSPALETDQARLCRMALPALTPEGARISIEAQRPDPDGRGLSVDFTAEAPGREPEPHVANCRFREPGRPRESRDLVSLTLDGEPLSDTQLFFLVRYWLSTPEGRAADPAPLGDVSGALRLPRRAAYGVQMALDGLPLSAIYALLAAAYSLVYGLIGRINFAFGELAAAGGYAAAMAALALAGLPPAPLLAAAFALAAVVACGWGFASARAVFIPLRNARGQQALVATVGLALFLQELLRIAQGDRTSWMSPLLNQPFALARSDDFIAVATPMTFVATAVMLAVGLGLVLIFRWTRTGREWRAYADDPLAAELLGVSPVADHDAGLRAVRGAGRPRRGDDDGGLRRGRLRALGHADPEGPRRRDRRRHRVGAGRLSRRSRRRGRRSRLVGPVPDRRPGYRRLRAAHRVHRPASVRPARDAR